MPESRLNPTSNGDDHVAIAFYHEVMQALKNAGIPFLVGGAYALSYYTGVSRYTKDLDVFIMRRDYERISEALRQAGYATELLYPHWLAKACFKEDFVDLIFSSGNGIAEVDEGWFERAPAVEVLDVPVRICAVEETIWSKAFIMERERYDGADIAHLLRARAESIDWHRLLNRFLPHWRVLLSHLTLFGFVYPAHRDLIPQWLMEDLIERLRQEISAPAPDRRICAGTLLSREQYLTDVGEQGYQDARIRPLGNMTEKEATIWTQAIRSGH